MSFGGNSTKAFPAPPQKALGLDETRASTNEQARPLPYFAGRNRLGVTWITDAFGVTAIPVTSTVGKGQTAITGYNYYANMAAAICHGPVDGIEKIFFNGDQVWESGAAPLQRASDISTSLTLEGHSRNDALIYWGTTVQNAGENLGASGLMHPRYPGQCILFFDQVYFGFNQTNAPNVEVVIVRHPEFPWSWEPEVPKEIGGDCNPVAIICELLLNPVFGLGWDLSRLDEAGLKAVATRLAAEEIGLSPCITKQTSARQLIAQICEYFDGYPLITPEGKFSLGLRRAPEDVNTLPSINEALLTEEPELDTESWRGVKTRTWVKFTDRTRSYKENVLSYRAPGNAQLAGDNSQQTLERPWITNPQFAQKLVAAAGRAAALPATSGSISVRKSAALPPGSLFRFSYAHLGIGNLVMRVVSCDHGKPGSREVSMEVMMDRSYLNEAYYVPPEDAAFEPLPTDPEPLEAHRMIELPRGLGDGQRITLSPLAPRPNFYTTGYNLHLRRSHALASIQPQVTTLFQFQPQKDAVVVQPPVQNVYLDESYSIIVQLPNTADPTLATAAGEYRLLWKYAPPGSSGSTGAWSTEWMIVLGWEPYTLPGDPDNYYVRVALLRGRRNHRMQYLPAGAKINQFRTPAPMVTSSFDRIAEHNRFAIRGTLGEEYPASTDLIDLYTGMVVDFGAATIDLESPSLNNALQNDWLIFVGEEILSMAEVEFLPDGRWRIWSIRARYDTLAATHPAGSEVYITPRSELKLLTHASFKRNSAAMFKFQPKVLNKILNLAEATSLTHRFTDRVNQPLCPTNLKAQGDGHAPFIEASAPGPLVLTWTLRETAPRDFWARFHDNPATVNASTILEFLTTGDLLKRTIPVPKGVSEQLYTTAQREQNFGTGPVTFKVRAYAFENGLRSRNYNELTINVI